MEDFDDPNEYLDAENPDPNDSDIPGFEHYSPEIDAAFEDSQQTLDEISTQVDDIPESPIEIGLADINTPTALIDVFTDPLDLPDSGEGLAEIYGDPISDAELWHQQTYPDTCAVVSQEYILETYFGREFSEEELAIEAMSKGYYAPGIGTYSDYVGNLLEDYGIEIDRSEGNTIEDLTNKLSENQKIIVAVDSNEIWYPSGEEQLKDLLFMPEANHAVMVTGYDDSTQTVILNDPGHPSGAGMKVNVEDFENAWNDSCNFMVSTVNAHQEISA
jgi:uncharacterized protein YvpB